MMGVREWMDKHRTVTMVAGAVFVLLAIGAIALQVMAQRKTFPAAPPDSYFSVDDGKTFFAASDGNIAPFDYQGQQAVRAYVFECDGTRFVGYLERYLPDVRQAILGGKKTIAGDRFGREVKRPGESKWTKSGGPDEAKICDVKCPKGSGTPVAIEP
jgi:hypothetical protein